MTVTVYVPRDASALSVGAGQVAEAISKEASARGVELRLVRNGSRGAFWLEPLVEVVTSQGRVGYGPVKAADVPGLFAADFLNGGQHPLALGVVAAIPWFASQQRLTFARVGIVDPTSVFPETNANVVTTENSDWATNCPEYKVTAVEVVLVSQKDAWQKRAQEERSIPKQQRKRKRERAPA
jgi:hypothetical protein